MIHQPQPKLHPRNFDEWNLKMMVSKGIFFLFWGLLFKFHVKFRGFMPSHQSNSAAPWKFNSSPYQNILKIYRAPKGSRIIFQASIFSGVFTRCSTSGAHEFSGASLACHTPLTALRRHHTVVPAIAARPP